MVKYTGRYFIKIFWRKNYENNKEEPKVKRFKIEKKIFIPEYALEDQIIKREVIADVNTTI